MGGDIRSMIKIIETRKFPEKVKTNFTLHVTNRKVKIEYIDGKLVSFDKCNLKYITAYRIIVYCKHRILEILYTGKNDDDHKLFYVGSLANPMSLAEIICIIEEMA